MGLAFKLGPPSSIHLSKEGIARFYIRSRSPAALGPAWAEVPRPNEPQGACNNAIFALCLQVCIYHLHHLESWLFVFSRNHDGNTVLSLHTLSGEENSTGLVGAIGTLFDFSRANHVGFCSRDDFERHDGQVSCSGEGEDDGSRDRKRCYGTIKLYNRSFFILSHLVQDLWRVFGETLRRATSGKTPRWVPASRTRIANP